MKLQQALSHRKQYYQNQYGYQDIQLQDAVC